MRTVDELRAFFAQCDDREIGREPDWEEHLAVIDASMREGVGVPSEELGRPDPGDTRRTGVQGTRGRSAPDHAQAPMIFVDVNVLVYAVGAPHPLRDEARAFFEESLVTSRPLATSAEVLQELLHVYLSVGRFATLDAALGAGGIVDRNGVADRGGRREAGTRAGRPSSWSRRERPSSPRLLPSTRGSGHQDLRPRIGGGVLDLTEPAHTAAPSPAAIALGAAAAGRGGKVCTNFSMPPSSPQT